MRIIFLKMKQIKKGQSKIYRMAYSENEINVSRGDGPDFLKISLVNRMTYDVHPASTVHYL